MAARKRKPKPSPAFMPWPIGVLAVDAATRSGWAVWACGRLIASGETTIDNAAGLVGICKAAMGSAMDAGGYGTVVMVLERAWGGPRNNVATLMALGAAHHAWRKAWADAGQPKSRIVRVYPATWRASLFGTTKGTKPLEAQRALNQKGIAPGPDEAAAICIGLWATRAGEVGAVLPAKIRKAVA